jgi:ribose transport system ATP-binding protein
VIGENGAGKSTLMKILGGVHQPSGGTILINGSPVQIKTVRDAIVNGISFIHQELNNLDNVDVAGNVFLGREPRKLGPLAILDNAKMHADAQPYLDQLGLGISSTTPMSHLSLAQQQMVEIAKALSLRAKVLIMDEPTSSLSLTETGVLLKVVKDLRQRGVAIIYISHRLGEIIEIADRVIALRDGSNAGSLVKSKITHEDMVRMMVGRDIDSFYAPRLGDERAVRFSVSGLRTKRFPNREVSFDIRGGEILGMAGLVGAGRSDVAQAIFGVDQPVGGSMTLDGSPVIVRSAADAINNGIYLAPEDRKKSGVILDMTIKDNITLPALKTYATLGMVNRRRERQSAFKASQSLGVKSPSVDFMVRNLSGGNQQKVVLAKWLSLSPKVLIFDEPTRGIDVGAKAEIYDLMRTLAKEGVAILMISSDMEEVLNLSDRIAVMHEGHITGFVARSEASEESIMRLAVAH